MTRQTHEEEADSRLLHRVLRLLEENQLVLLAILERLPPPAKYRPTIAIVVVPTASLK